MLRRVLEELKNKSIKKTMIVFSTDWVENQIPDFMPAVTNYCVKHKINMQKADPENTDIQKLFREFEVEIPQLIPCIMYYDSDAGNVTTKKFGGSITSEEDLNIFM